MMNTPFLDFLWQPMLQCLLQLEVLLPLLITPIPLLLRLTTLMLLLLLLMLLLLLHKMSLASHLLIHVRLLLHTHVRISSAHS